MVKGNHISNKKELSKTKKKLEQLKRYIKKSHARVAVSLSSGGAEAMGRDLALMELLVESNIDYQEIHGSSAGAAVGAAYSTWPVTASQQMINTETEKSVPFVRKGFLELTKPNSIFELSRPSIRNLFLRQGSVTGIFAGNRLEYRIGEGFGNATFADCYKDIYIYAEKEGELGYETFSRYTFADLPVHEAIRASVSIPYFFEPKSVEGKNYIDGGMLVHSPLHVVIQNHIKKTGGMRRPLLIFLCTRLYPYRQVEYSENIWEAVKSRYFYKILSRIFFRELTEALSYRNVHLLLFYPEIEPIGSFAFNKMQPYLVQNKENFKHLLNSYLDQMSFRFYDKRLQFKPKYNLGPSVITEAVFDN